MPTATSATPSTGVPEGYCAIPIQESELGATIRLCALAKLAPDPAGPLILLRDLPDAMVYLGCLTDAEGHLREWAEIWVQNVDGLESSLPAVHESFSNKGLDDRWAGMARSFAALNPGNVLRTGWESRHPLPTWLDTTKGFPVHPTIGDQHWELCQDDAALRAAALPAYGTSLFRYLYRPGSKDDGFVPVVAGAPTNNATRQLADILKGSPASIPFNPQGGLLMARSHAPLSYEDYVDVLGGKAWKGLEHGKRTVTFDGAYKTLGDAAQMQQSGSHLFLGGQGRAGRFVETFHLKLRLFVEALSAIRNFVAREQLPFLNLSAESFNVILQDLGGKLPFLWTAECQLGKPPEAFALPVPSSDLRYFIRARPGGASVYRPDNLNAAVQGSGSVRIRTVLPPDQGRTLLEGTLVASQGLNVSPHDLLWIRLPLPIGRVDLYGHLYTDEGLSQGEARFRTVAQSLAPEIVAALRAAEGVAFPRAPFEVVPLLSTPCDLYALGVLAVRTLLVNLQNTLPVALDGVLSLARRLGSEHKPEIALPARVAGLMAQEPHFAKSLAPNRLVQEDLEPAAAFELLPAELWYHTLAAVVRFFPGIGPDSYCKDYGDAPSLALETVFNQPLEDLEQLLVRSRSLIVIDWRSNREVHSAIRDVLDRQHIS
ncbi:MAG TPA: hypothetical protein VFE51_12490 [Verrucomicrobiae bacterium]|nr:hypothetical protein [Verrucomicrobiae bacterium]